MSSLGWQASGNIGSLRPFGRVTWEKDYNNDDREVRAGLVSMPGTFAIPAFGADGQLLRCSTSAPAPIWATGWLASSASARPPAKDDGNYQAVTVGVPHARCNVSCNEQKAAHTRGLFLTTSAR